MLDFLSEKKTDKNIAREKLYGNRGIFVLNDFFISVAGGCLSVKTTGFISEKKKKKKETSVCSKICKNRCFWALTDFILSTPANANGCFSVKTGKYIAYGIFKV